MGKCTFPNMVKPFLEMALTANNYHQIWISKFFLRMTGKVTNIRVEKRKEKKDVTIISNNVCFIY